MTLLIYKWSYEQGSTMQNLDDSSTYRRHGILKVFLRPPGICFKISHDVWCVLYDDLTSVWQLWQKMMVFNVPVASGTSKPRSNDRPVFSVILTTPNCPVPKNPVLDNYMA